MPYMLVQVLSRGANCPLTNVESHLDEPGTGESFGIDSLLQFLYVTYRVVLQVK
jgi:hypothetical protein